MLNYQEDEIEACKNMTLQKIAIRLDIHQLVAECRYITVIVFSITEIYTVLVVLLLDLKIGDKNVYFLVQYQFWIATTWLRSGSPSPFCIFLSMMKTKISSIWIAINVCGVSNHFFFAAPLAPVSLFRLDRIS